MCCPQHQRDERGVCVRGVCGDALACELHEAAGGQHGHKLSAGERRGDPPGEPVGKHTRAGTALISRTRPDRGSDAGSRTHRHRGDSRAGAHARAPQPRGQRSRQEQRGKGDDREEAGEDETQSTEQRRAPAAQAPGAVDRKLRGGGAGQQVGGGDRALELLARQPLAPAHAQLAKQRNVCWRTAEPDAADASPLAHDVRQRWCGCRLRLSAPRWHSRQGTGVLGVRRAGAGCAPARRWARGECSADDL
jgi:hypothetical protein